MRRLSLVLVSLTAAFAAPLLASGCGTDTSGTGGDEGGSGGAAGDASADGPGDAKSDADAAPDGDGGTTCPAISFLHPTDGASLTDADDADGDHCQDGFQYDVLVATDAPDGTTATLFAGSSNVATAKVSGAAVTFKSVQLNPNGATTLKVQVGASATCAQTIQLSVACPGVPSCDVSAPVISTTHPMLNGVPATEGGDRVSPDGAPYQAAFEVTTSIEDGQPVLLTIDGASTGVTVNAVGGKATFPGVTLAPDGDHTVVATCTAKSTLQGKSPIGHFPVDSAAPDLTVTQPTDGQHFQGSSTFTVCGTTAAADALDLPSTLGSAANNFCAAIGTSSPECAAASASTSDGACVDLPCPGGAPFDVTVTLTDGAGNPVTKKITGVTCASTTPSVQIVDPVDGTGSDVATHILAASANQARKDADANTPGAQYTVTACTDASAGDAQLLAGLKGGTLTKLGASVAVAPAQPGDGCPNGLGYVAKFSGVTLPESEEDSSGALTTATELRVDVTDISQATGSSPLVDTWVDSGAPALQPSNPSPLCGKLYQSATPVTTNLTFYGSSVPVSVTVTGTNGSQTYTANAFSGPGVITVSGVTFGMGSNDVAATASELSGNVTSLSTPCVVSVGNPPVVTWVTPTQASKLNGSTDGNAGTAGWQGDLTVCTDVDPAANPGATITFDANGTVLGTVALNGGAPPNNCATLTGASIPDGDPVKLTATTSDIPGEGAGSSSLTFTVDTVTPDAVTGLTASVKVRRETRFHLAWTAPQDGSATKAVSGYEVRVSKSPITTQAQFDAAEAVPYSTTPATPGNTDGVDVSHRYIENDYYFAVAPLDKAGNEGAFVATGPAKATFNLTTFSGGPNELLGYSKDGSADVNGDGYADLLVGAGGGTKAYLYFGGASGFGATPSVTFSGSTTEFGVSVRVIGDIDSDGKPDVAVGSDLEQKVYVFLGKTIQALTSFPATISTPDAVVVADAGSDAGFTGALFGSSIARIGDFNGDGADDFAIGAQGYSSKAGYLAIVYGVPSGQSFPGTVTLPTDLGTRATAIAGTVASGRFGFMVVGLGKYYPTSGSTIVVGAPRSNSDAGRVYAFAGPLAGSKLDAETVKKAAVDGPAASSRFGSIGAVLGNIAGSSDADLAIAAPSTGAGAGQAIAYFGSGSTSPFSGTPAVFTDSAATAAGDRFSFVTIGGGFSGTAAVTSFLGDATPDLAFSSIFEGGAAPKLYFIDGAKAASSANVTTVADVVYALPSNWAGSAFDNSAIRDLDKDGYGDLAIGEFSPSGTGNGRVLVLW